MPVATIPVPHGTGQRVREHARGHGREHAQRACGEQGRPAEGRPMPAPVLGPARHGPQAFPALRRASPAAATRKPSAANNAQGVCPPDAPPDPVPTPPLGIGFTVVVVLSVLLEMFGSGVCDVAVALFRTVPTEFVVTTMVTVMVAPLS